MEHWRFFVAILLLLILLRPVHEYFTEDDANRMNSEIAILKSQVSSLNAISPKTPLQISQSIIDLSNNVNQLGTVVTPINDVNTTFISDDLETSGSYTKGIEFNLTKGKWFVVATGTYSPSSRVNNYVFLSLHPTIKAVKGDNYAGFNRSSTIGYAGNSTNWIRYQLSLTINVTTENQKSYLNVYEATAGSIWVTITATKIGF